MKSAASESTATPPATRGPRLTSTPSVAPLPVSDGVVVLPAAAIRGSGDVSAEILNLQGGGINVAKATRVDVRQGGISRVEAKDVSVSMGGIAIARADRISTEMSGVAVALAGKARISRSFVRGLLARDVQLDRSAAWSVLAGRVTFRRQNFAGVVIARRVDGEVRTLFDWRGAVVVAGVVGVAMAVFRRR